jgi:hypothetical protein
MNLPNLVRIRRRARALVRHYYGGLRRALFKLSWAILRFIWPETSSVLRYFARANGLAGPRPGKYETALVLVSESFEKETVRTSNGPDLENELVRWLKTDLAIKNVRFIKDLEESNPTQGASVLVVSYDKLGGTHDAPPTNVIATYLKLATQAKSRGLPVWPVIPDTFFFAHSLVSSILVAVCGGAIPLISNSESEATAYGLPNPVSPIFWTWNQSYTKEWGPITPWAKRRDTALFAASGDERRTSWFQPIKEHLKQQGWEVHESTGRIPWLEYMAQVKTAKLIVTTNSTQAWFFLGPRRYMRRVGESTVTNRTWEAFASATPVLCNSTPHLQELGFIPGTHFLDLNDFLRRPGSFAVPSDRALRKIGLAGHELFTVLAASGRDLTRTLA